MYFFYLPCGSRTNEYVVRRSTPSGCNRKAHKVEIKNDFCLFFKLLILVSFVYHELVYTVEKRPVVLFILKSFNEIPIFFLLALRQCYTHPTAENRLVPRGLKSKASRN